MRLASRRGVAALLVAVVCAVGSAACGDDERPEGDQRGDRGGSRQDDGRTTGGARPGARAGAARRERGAEERKSLPAYGVQAWAPYDLDRQDFGLLSDSGAGFFRFNLLTSSTGDREPAAIRPYDRLIAKAAAEGVELLPVLMRSRAKDRDPADQVAAPPEGARERAEWERRVRFFAERYGPKGSLWRERPGLPYRPIRVWEVWNEPNLPQFWDERAANPREYARLLRATRRVLRDVDPKARVVLGGIASRHSGPSYLGDVLDAAGECSADALSIHPYAPNVERAMAHLADSREVADARGLDDVPLWTTEIGWRIGGRGGGDVELGYSEVATPAAQARLTEGFLEATERRREPLGLGPTFAFALRDRVNAAGEVDNRSGLRLADDSPRRAWKVFARRAAAASGLRWPEARDCGR